MKALPSSIWHRGLSLPPGIDLNSESFESHLWQARQAAHVPAAKRAFSSPRPAVLLVIARYDTRRRRKKSTRTAPRVAAAICHVLCREGRTITRGEVTVGTT